MGITKAKLAVKKSHESKNIREVNFLFDSGAVYSLVPKEILKAHGIKSYKTVSFSMADGTPIERQVGDAYFEFKGVAALPL